MLDLLHVTEFQHAAAVSAAQPRAAHAHDHRLKRIGRATVGLTQRGGHGIGYGLLVGDPPFVQPCDSTRLAPAKRMRLFSRTQITSRVRRLPRPVLLRKSVSLPLPFYSFT
jgi:hypothetical protein